MLPKKWNDSPDHVHVQRLSPYGHMTFQIILIRELQIDLLVIHYFIFWIGSLVQRSSSPVNVNLLCLLPLCHKKSGEVQTGLNYRLPVDEDEQEAFTS